MVEQQLREWLEEKQERGVQQVRIASALAQLDQSENGHEPEVKNAIDAFLAGLTRKQRFAVMRRLLYDLHPEFVGTKEAAELLGIERPRIGRYLRTGVMPQPIGIVSKSIPFWLRADVEPLRALVERRRREHDKTAK